MKRRYFLQCSFNGKNYSGWQKQPNKKTVQTTIDEALSTALQDNIEVMGAGRTDTGVHAKYFIVHFDTLINLAEITNLVYKLNNILPKDIAVQDIFEVSEVNHSRFDAVSRSYQYIITTKKNPFLLDGAYYIKNDLDVKLMHNCAQQLKSFSNFKSFSKVKTDVKTFDCIISQARVYQNNESVIVDITANRFLRNMVRAISGTLIDVGLKKTNMEAFKTIILSQDRRKAGKSVPAKGLYLTAIEYPFALKSIYEQK